MKKITFLPVYLLAVAIAIPIGTIKAQSIGVDFSGGGPVATALSSTDIAGFVPQANWNNITTNNGSIAAGSVVDSNGTILPGVTASSDGSNDLWTFGTYPFTNDPNQAGDKMLYSAAMDQHGVLGDYYYSSLTISNIPYATYDVYVYFEDASAGSMINIGGATAAPGGFTGGTTFSMQASNGLDGFVAATAGTPSSNTNTSTFGPAADYAVLQGLSGADLTVYHIGSASGITGMQIVNASVPEPQTWAAMLSGACLFAVWRFKGRRPLSV